MRGALFLNGVYESVLVEILRIQELLPEQILYIQPYSRSRIAGLRTEPPSVEDPVQLLISTTKDLGWVTYTTEIVGWRNKRNIPIRTKRMIDCIIKTLQPREEGLYERARGVECVNLLFVRRLKKLKEPLQVEELRLTRHGRSPKGRRSTAGNWWYIDRVKL